MKKISVLLASTSQGKLRELHRLLGDPRMELISMTNHVPSDYSVEETGTTFHDNAWLKACALAELTGLPSLADDSGIEVDALAGRPGVYSARYAGLGATDAANNALLLEELGRTGDSERRARFRCVLAFAVPSAEGPTRRAETSGAIEGRILMAPRGDHGFGYDPLFAPLEFSGRTTAELSPEEKNAVSHRGIAARAMQTHISAWLDEVLQS